MWVQSTRRYLTSPSSPPRLPRHNSGDKRLLVIPPSLLPPASRHNDRSPTATQQRPQPLSAVEGGGGGTGTWGRRGEGRVREG